MTVCVTFAVGMGLVEFQITTVRGISIINKQFDLSLGPTKGSLFLLAIIFKRNLVKL